jgi:DNA polymerase-1
VGGKILFWSKKKEEQGKQKADKYTENYEHSNKRPCWNSSAFAKYFTRLKNENNQRAYAFVFHYYQADHRARLSATYLETMIQKKDVNDVLHPSLNQHGTVTGRFSSSNPNCQNISRVEGNADLKKIEKIIGYQEDALNRSLRDLFIPRAGFSWVKWDFSQIEYIVATYLSQDQEMIQRFWDDPNLDYHQITADLASITRDQAKTVNFGSLYGLGIHSLAAMLGISVPEAKHLMAKVYEARPALKRLIYRVSDEAKVNKHVYLPFGRVVPVDPNKPYVALNYLDQGTSAYLMKDRLIAIQEAIRENHWPVHLLLTVHDEVDAEMPVSLVQELAPKIATIMCDVQRIIPMPVTCAIEFGRSWGNLEELPWVNPWTKQKQKEAA